MVSRDPRVELSPSPESPRYVDEYHEEQTARVAAALAVQLQSTLKVRETLPR